MSLLDKTDKELLEIAKFQFCSANTLLFSFDIDELLQISNKKLRVFYITG